MMDDPVTPSRRVTPTMEKRNKEKDLRLLRKWEKDPPKSLVSRYAHFHLKRRHKKGA